MNMVMNMYMYMHVRACVCVCVCVYMYMYMRIRQYTSVIAWAQEDFELTTGLIGLSAMAAAPPDPPSGWSKPDGYLAVRCQICNSWSTSAMPYEPENKSRDKWYPLLPWNGGTRNCPKGLTCNLCANVFLLSE